MGTLEYSSVRTESQTYDESNQLMTGFGFWKLGRYTAGIEHPPLAKLLLTAPLLTLGLDLPPGFPRTIMDLSDSNISKQFLYHNHASADVILGRGRWVAICISLAFGLTLALWTRRWFGPTAALLALALYALDPNLTAHGRYAKNDVAAAWTIFLAAACWTEYLTSRQRPWLMASGLALGAALATKFSAIVLLPAYPLFAVYARRRDREFRPGRPLLGVALISALVIFCVYDFEVESLRHSGLSAWFARLSASHPGMSASLPSRLPALLTDVPFPEVSFLRGLKMVGNKERTGQSMGYLLGSRNHSGWWYFPFVVLGVKMPLAVLLLTLITIVLVLRNRPSLALPSVRVAGMTLPILLYFVASMTTSQNAGIRHLLPLLPFLYLALGWFWARQLESGVRWPILALAMCGLLLAAENMSIYPHYLAFFNIASGGPRNGPAYLIDSNLDWGQDVKNLKRYLTEHRAEDPCVSYHGTAELDYYGIQARPVPPAETTEQVNAIDCMVAVSASLLYLPDSKYDALRTIEPDAQIGYSIYVYDLRKGPR